jgi:hypothetical protein
MSDLFMWYGFLFCAFYHVGSYILLFSDHSVQSGGTVDTTIINIGLSGIGLCYFGMQAFA